MSMVALCEDRDTLGNISKKIENRLVDEARRRALLHCNSGMLHGKTKSFVDGFIEGFIEGFVEGKKEAIHAFVHALRHVDLDASFIADALGLEVKVVEDILKQEPLSV